MKVYTFYESIGFENQTSILKSWEKSWRKNGFETHVLGLSDALSHPLYNLLLEKLDEKNSFYIGAKFSNNCKSAKFHFSSLARWLAWANAVTEPSIVCDFDVINNGFTLTEPIENKLIFRNGTCLCLASGNGVHFSQFIQMLINNLDDFYRKTKILNSLKEGGRNFFHDQDFVDHTLNIIDYEKHYDFGFDKYPIMEYDYFNKNINSFKLLHVSHFCVNHMFKKHIREKNLNLSTYGILNDDCENIRVSFVKSILSI